MPYRTSYYPITKPPWEKCRCRHISPGKEHKTDNRGSYQFMRAWICCRCGMENNTYTNSFCVICNHARDLLSYETEGKCPELKANFYTHSPGPR